MKISLFQYMRTSLHSLWIYTIHSGANPFHLRELVWECLCIHSGANPFHHREVMWDSEKVSKSSVLVVFHAMKWVEIQCGRTVIHDWDHAWLIKFFICSKPEILLECMLVVIAPSAKPTHQDSASQFVMKLFFLLKVTPKSLYWSVIANVLSRFKSEVCSDSSEVDTFWYLIISTCQRLHHSFRTISIVSESATNMLLFAYIRILTSHIDSPRLRSLISMRTNALW